MVSISNYSQNTSNSYFPSSNTLFKNLGNLSNIVINTSNIAYSNFLNFELASNQLYTDMVSISNDTLFSSNTVVYTSNLALSTLTKLDSTSNYIVPAFKATSNIVSHNNLMLNALYNAIKNTTINSNAQDFTNFLYNLSNALTDPVVLAANTTPTTFI